MAKKETEENAEKTKKRRMFLLNDADLLFPAWMVVTLEKDHRLNKRSQWEYGIVVNKGLEGGTITSPMGEKSVWYEDEATRDKRFEAMLDTLMSENYNITVI